MPLLTKFWDRLSWCWSGFCCCCCEIFETRNDEEPIVVQRPLERAIPQRQSFRQSRLSIRSDKKAFENALKALASTRDEPSNVQEESVDLMLEDYQRQVNQEMVSINGLVADVEDQRIKGLSTVSSQTNQELQLEPIEDSTSDIDNSEFEKMLEEQIKKQEQELEELKKKRMAKK